MNRRGTDATADGPHGHGHGCGPRGALEPRLSREGWVRRLEEYQRDLEQEPADVADLIRRLKEDAPAEPATASA